MSRNGEQGTSERRIDPRVVYDPVRRTASDADLAMPIDHEHDRAITLAEDANGRWPRVLRLGRQPLRFVRRASDLQQQRCFWRTRLSQILDFHVEFDALLLEGHDELDRLQ